jgi:hypothetical protein
MRTLSGDEWKTAPEPPREPWRARLHRVNLDFAFDKIDLAEWRKRTDQLCEPTGECCRATRR